MQVLLRVKAKQMLRFDGAKLAAGKASGRRGLARRFAKAERRRDCPGPSDPAVASRRLEQFAGLGGRLRGVVEAAKIVTFPAGVWPEVLVHRAVFEGKGFVVADDGSRITGPPMPAPGWLARMGDDAPAEGSLHHPSDDAVVAGPIRLVDLAGDVEALRPIVFDIATPGACGMNGQGGPEPDECGGFAASSRHHPVTPFAQLNPDPMRYPPRITTEVGTYPNDDPDAAQVACLDYDGYVDTGERGDNSVRGAVSYPGSTCQMQVSAGCCDNEAATVRRRLQNLADPVQYPVLACTTNHDGRYCQQIMLGDLSIAIDGDVVRPGGNREYEVRGGDRIGMAVHNNGCYGRTEVAEVLGESAPIGGHIAASNFDGVTLRHAGFGGVRYLVDAPVDYVAPTECPPPSGSAGRWTSPRDTYQFSSEGSTVTVSFYCRSTTTTIECPSGAFGALTVCRPHGVTEWVGTARYTSERADAGLTESIVVAASITVTNDPALFGGGTPGSVFVVKEGSVTYSESRRDACVFTATGSASLTPYPGGIPGSLVFSPLPDGRVVVSGVLIQSVPVTETEVCPPDGPAVTSGFASAVYLSLQGDRHFLNPDDTTFAGSESADGATFTWSLSRREG